MPRGVIMAASTGFSADTLAAICSSFASESLSSLLEHQVYRLGYLPVSRKIPAESAR